ncbi:MAG: hypothetical protein J0M25_00780 [Flavobacteriales bacterium]|nr:hypothetical protein [Flavobacteriales bacterium]
MKTFNIKLVREDEYKIEVDSEVWNEEARKDFETVFWPLPELEDVAKSVAEGITRRGIGQFYEGFGHLVTFRDGKEMIQRKIVNGQIHKREAGDYCKGIIVHILDFDYDYSIEILKDQPCQQ